MINIKDVIISVLNNAYSTQVEHRELFKVLDAIKNELYKDAIAKIRNESDPKEQTNLKKNLPSVLFSGKFLKREDDFIQEHSGLCILDFDKLDNISETKNKIISYPFVLACFNSPSGNGLKVLIRIQNNKFTHAYQYASLCELFPNLDTTSRNLSRQCFMCSDKDIYINYDAEIYTGFSEKDKNKEVIIKKGKNTNYALLSIAVNKIRNAIDGKKHSELLKASYLIGGYIANGYVEEDEALRILDKEIQKRNINDPTQAKKTICDAIEEGKKRPLDLQHEENSKIKLDDIIENNKYTKDDNLTFVANEESIEEYLQKVKSGGLEQGLPFGIPSLDEYLLFKRSEVYVNLGHDNTGKSNILWYLLVLLAKNYSFNFIIASFENKSGAIARKIIEYYFCKEIKHLSVNQYQEGLKFYKEHFTIIKNEDNYTYKDILSMSAKLSVSKEYHAVLIDPYNALYRDRKKSDTAHDYDYFVMGDMLQYAKKYNQAVFINMHPSSEAARRRHPDKHPKYSGLIMPPHKADAEGGTKFPSRADNFIITHRYAQHPDEWMITQIHVQKVRETETGGRQTFFDEPVLLWNKFNVGFETQNGYNPILKNAQTAKEYNFEFNKTQSEEDINF